MVTWCTSHVTLLIMIIIGGNTSSVQATAAITQGRCIQHFHGASYASSIDPVECVLRCHCVHGCLENATCMVVKHYCAKDSSNQTWRGLDCQHGNVAYEKRIINQPEPPRNNDNTSLPALHRLLDGSLIENGTQACVSVKRIIQIDLGRILNVELVSIYACEVYLPTLQFRYSLSLNSELISQNEFCFERIKLKQENSTAHHRTCPEGRATSGRFLNIIFDQPDDEWSLSEIRAIGSPKNATPCMGCFNGGYCNWLGVCLCQQGYSGVKCEVFNANHTNDKGISRTVQTAKAMAFGTRETDKTATSTMSIIMIFTMFIGITMAFNYYNDEDNYTNNNTRDTDNNQVYPVVNRRNNFPFTSRSPNANHIEMQNLSPHRNRMWP